MYYKSQNTILNEVAIFDTKKGSHKYIGNLFKKSLINYITHSPLKVKTTLHIPLSIVSLAEGCACLYLNKS